MIIHEKIKAKYPNYKYDSTKKCKLNTLAKKYDLELIGYDYDDFIKDYGDEYSKYKEIKTVFNILKTGEYLSSFLTNKFLTFLVKGFNFNFPIVSKENLKKALSVVVIECDYKLYNLRLDVYKRHVELFGEFENLEKFKNDFNLKYEIILDKTKDEWHIAFDGRLAEYLKTQANN